MDSWVGVAAVDMAGRAALGYRPPGVHIGVAERDALHHRHLRGALDKVAFFARCFVYASMVLPILFVVRFSLFERKTNNKRR